MFLMAPLSPSLLIHKTISSQDVAWIIRTYQIYDYVREAGVLNARTGRCITYADLSMVEPAVALPIIKSSRSSH